MRTTLSTRQKLIFKTKLFVPQSFAVGRGGKNTTPETNLTKSNLPSIFSAIVTANLTLISSTQNVSGNMTWPCAQQQWWIKLR